MFDRPTPHGIPDSPRRIPGLAAVDHAVRGLLHRELEEVLARRGRPDILNTDQGSQFTSNGFIEALKAAEIAISMDGSGAWRDNILVERLWRTVKYEKVHLRAYTSVPEARTSIGRYVAFYNGRRPHSSLGGQTPDQAFLTPLQPMPAAA